MSSIESSQLKVINTTYFSIGFPFYDEPILRRDNYISQIEGCLHDGAKLVFIDGDEDSGKTTLLSEYARTRLNEVITVFFNPFNDIDYTIAYFCKNIVDQLRYLLGENVEEDAEEVIGIEVYRKYIYLAQKLGRKNGKTLTLVIDGLENKINEKSDFIKDLIPSLPIDTLNIVITANEAAFKLVYGKPKSLITGSVTLAGFTTHEISEYLVINESEVNRDIYKVSKGFPGRLKTLKRLISKDGYSLENITASTTYKSWIELDCGSIDYSKPLTNVILSLFSLSDKSFTPEEVSRITEESPEAIVEALTELRVFDRTNKSVKFLSNSYKKHFANILRANKRKIQDLLINYYSSDHAVASAIELTKLYADCNKWESLVAVVEEDLASKVIKTTGSSKTANECLGLGILAAQKLDRYTEMLKYSIEAGLINELDSYLFWESEIAARIAIKDFSGAISLAETAVLKVDRLKLLSVIARQQKEINGSVEDDLSMQILQLYNSADLTTIGPKIFSVISNLIYAIPQLAISIMEKVSSGGSDNNINDLLVANLSVAAIDSSLKEKEDLESSKTVMAVQSLGGENIKKLNKAITMLVGNYTGTKVLDEISRIKDASERIRLLRLWLSNREESRTSDKEIGAVIAKALDELVAYSAEKPITIDVLREVSSQLPFVTDKKVKDKLYYRFLEIEKSVPETKSIRNRFIYRLNLIHTEYTIDSELSLDSVQKLVNTVDKVEDILVCAEVLAETHHLLILLNDRMFDKLIRFLHARLLELTTELFNNTSNQLKICEYTLKTLGKRSPVLALKIAERINLERYRDKAVFFILQSYLTSEISQINISILKGLESNLVFKYTRDLFYLEILERYAKEEVGRFRIEDMFYFFQKVKDISLITNKMPGYVYMYKIVHQKKEWQQKYAKDIEKKIEGTLSQIEAEWDRIDFGFTVCSDIAKISPQFARAIFEKSSALKRSSWIDCSPVADAYVNSVKLVIFSFETLIAADKVLPEDEKIIEDLLNRNPSDIKRLELWTELALRSYSMGNDAYSRKLNDQHVLPLLEGLIHKRIDLFEVRYSFILVYLFNAELAFRYVSNLPFEVREQVYADICDYLVTKKSPYDLFEFEDGVYNTSFNDLTKAVALLSRIFTDSMIYWCIADISKAIVSQRSSLSPVQVSTLIADMEKLTDTRFPDKKNIRHEGYKIIATMRIFKAKRDLPNQKQEWSKLITQAKQIPNKSDEIFVLALLLTEVPFERLSDGGAMKEQLFDDVINKLKALPLRLEFLERVADLSDKLYPLNRKIWKQIVDKAFEIYETRDSDAENIKSQKRIIDGIYRVDQEYAKELAKRAEAQSNRDKETLLLKRHMAMLEIASKIKKDATLEENEKNNYRLIVESIIEVTKSINSNRVAAKKIADASMYLPLATKLPLNEMLPVYIYYLVNCLKTYKYAKNIGNITDLHRENFKKAVTASEIIEILSARKKIGDATSRKYFIDEGFSGNKVFNPGSRDRALNYIKSWVADEVDEFVIIADPYFRKEDLEIVKIIIEQKKDIEIHVLGSEGGEESNLKQQYLDHWKLISGSEPPFIDFTFCWTNEEKNHPFHDRCIVTKHGGLRIGTSFSSLGMKKDSEISTMTSSQALEIKENSLSELVSRKKRIANNARVIYSGFTF